MGIRIAFAIALGAALLVAALGSPAPGSSQMPSTSASAPALSPVATPTPAPGLPKVLGHVYTSAYCTEFVDRYNTAATSITLADTHLTSVDGTLQHIEDDYDRTDGGARVYDDRIKLIDDETQLMKTIPVTQSAVNALLAQAKSTTDPVRKAALQQSASQLQSTVDRQRAVANDLSSVIHVLMDKRTSEDTAEYNIQLLLPAGYRQSGTLLDDAVPEPGGGGDAAMRWTASPSPSPGATVRPGSVEDILQWSRQRSIIQTSEGNAAAAADRIIRICDDDPSPSPAASASGLPTSSPLP